MHRAGKLFGSSYVLKSWCNAYVLSNQVYCPSVWMSSAESDLGLLYWLVLFAVQKGFVRVKCVVWSTEERVGPCVSSVGITRVENHMHDYLHHFVAALNTRVLAALSELALAIPRCRTDQFSWSFLPTAFHLWNLLSSGVLSGGTLSSFKNIINLCLLRA